MSSASLSHDHFLETRALFDSFFTPRHFRSIPTSVPDPLKFPIRLVRGLEPRLLIPGQ